MGIKIIEDADLYSKKILRFFCDECMECFYTVKGEDSKDDVNEIWHLIKFHLHDRILCDECQKHLNNN